ncbi:cupin domain-containing protein [soil metagenome]
MNITEKLATFTEHWQPRVITSYNDNDVMVVKLLGEFLWHKHDETDDFFLVIKGTLDIQLRDRTVTLNAGELFVVPKGVEHRPVAKEEVHLLLIEPRGTPNTGDPATAVKRQVI